MVILYFENNGLSFDLNDIAFYETTSWAGEKAHLCLSMIIWHNVFGLSISGKCLVYLKSETNLKKEMKKKIGFHVFLKRNYTSKYILYQLKKCHKFDFMTTYRSILHRLFYSLNNIVFLVCYIEENKSFL